MGNERRGEALSRALAGSVAGVTEAVLLNPTDITKSHIHAGSFPRPDGRAPTLRSTLRGIHETSGLRGFTRGTTALAAHLGIKYPVRYFVNTASYSLVGQTRGATSPGVNFALGAMTGLVEVMLVVAPIENLKTYQQMAVRKGLPLGYPAAVRYTIERHGGGLRGLKGFWSGASPTVLRNMMNQAFLFSVSPIIIRALTPNDPNPPIYASFLGGTIAATIGPALNNGLDQAKTRMMVPGNTKSMVAILREDIGLRYWFRGLLPRLARIGPGGGIQIAIVSQLAPVINQSLFADDHPAP